MNVRPGVETAGLSDVGCQRENNEDSYLYWEPADEDEFKRKGRLAIIADGMGGHEGGLEASRLAVDTVREVYEAGYRDDPQAMLVEGFAAAHMRIRDYAERHPPFYGMGTTCTALVVRERQLFFAHVGDSRLYRVRDERIERLTRDHSYVRQIGGKRIGARRRCGKAPSKAHSDGSLGSWARVGSRQRRTGLASTAR